MRTDGPCHQISFNAKPLHALAATSGFPLMLCHITAIIPIMAKPGTPYPRHYPHFSAVFGDAEAPLQTPPPGSDIGEA